jgi:predicted secreted protein
MAFTPYHNITGSSGVDVELIAPESGAGSIQSILITNTDATADATVTLFIEDDPTAVAASIFKILSTVAIPADTSLLLDNSSMISFDNNTYGLYMTVGSSDTLDVMINI